MQHKEIKMKIFKKSFQHEPVTNKQEQSEKRTPQQTTKLWFSHFYTIYKCMFLLEKVYWSMLFYVLQKKKNLDIKWISSKIVLNMHYKMLIYNTNEQAQGESKFSSLYVLLISNLNKVYI